MKTERFAVIGHPIGHTMSPFIHRRLFALNGLSPLYEALDIPSLAEGVEGLRAYDGVNITIPHKQGILPYLAYTDPRAVRFGSVNTLKIENGRMSGYTTDGEGCLQALKDGGAALDGGILLLGSGGAARAIAYSLGERGAAVDICVRSPEKGRALLAGLKGKGRVLSFSQAEEEDTTYGLLINATSVGMYPNSGESPVTKRVVRRCESLFDAVYNPHFTALLGMGREEGKNLIFGIDMLVYQAAEAHRIWYGGAFRREDLRALCAQAARERERLFGV